MKKYLLIILVLFAACTPVRKYLLIEEDHPGWQLAEWQTYSKNSEINSELGQNASLYTGYGLKEFIRQQYVSSDFKVIHIEMYFMDTNQGAKSLYNRFKTLFALEIGTESCENPGFVIFYRDNCVVKVIGVRNLEGENYLLREFAQKIDLKLINKL